MRVWCQRHTIADLARGSDGLKELQTRFHNLGGEMGQDQAVGLRDLGNKLKDLHVAWDGMRNAVIAAVAPMLTELAEGAAKFFAENRKEIIEALTFAFHALGAAIKVVATVFRFVIDVFKDASKGSTAAIGAVIGLALAILSFLVPAVLAAVGAVGMFLLELAPFIAAGLAIAFVAKLVRDNWDDIVRFFENIADGIASAFRAVADIITDVFDAVKSAIGAVIDWCEGKVKWVKDKVDWVLDKAKAVGDFLGITSSGDGDKGAGTGSQSATSTSGLRDPSTGLPLTTSAPTTNVSPGGGSGNIVNVGPTNVQITGVKGAAEAKSAIGDSIDNRTRHASAALGGGR